MLCPEEMAQDPADKDREPAEGWAGEDRVTEADKGQE